MNSFCCAKTWTTVALLFLAADFALGSDDAYVRQEGQRWIIGSAKVERVVALEDGRFILKSLGDRVTGRDLTATAISGGEFFFGLGSPPERLSGASGGWKLVDSQKRALTQGALELDITLERNAVQVTKSYVVYPSSSIIREWVTLKNSGLSPIRVIEPGFLNLSFRLGDPQSLDFDWMTGGENNPGSWKLKSESLNSQKPREFDSYEPFPMDLPTGPFPGDGVLAKILMNDRQVWPASGWADSANATVRVPFDFGADINAGDKLVFLVNMKGNIGWDTTEFNPAIAYDDGETHLASKEFDREQGKSGWKYQYLEKGEFHDLVYYPGPNQWRKKQDNATGTPFIGADNQHPDNGQDATRVWVAPKSGHIRVSGTVCNTGNGSAGRGNYGFRPGTASYAPWYALYNKKTKEGVFIGWDYFGHWRSSFSLSQDGAVTAQLTVAGHKQTLAPGESVSSPKAFAGLYQENLDNAGNECLDWQYAYLWDYTREGWFPAIRMLGYWSKGTAWGQANAGWRGGSPDFESTFRKVFRMADLMRYVGADVYHRDWGWWDRAGDWNGPDFRATSQYLRKYGMGQLIYAFLYTVDGQSQVARAHPDWLLGGNLDLSRPEVVQFIEGQLKMFVQRWGDFEWRNDSLFTEPRDGDDTPLLAQDKGFRKVIRDFLDQYPRCAFQAVNGGGNCGGYDYTRYSSSFSFSDGAVGILRNYYAALLFPPDKTSDIPDVWDPGKYDKASWRGLLCINFDMTGDTWDPDKLEGLRELVGIYHYLQTKGVVGRWVHVYRPVITGDDPTMYLQRLSKDSKRGVIISKHPAPGAVTIKPKGLLANETYFVSFHESPESGNRTGADLMARGISIEKMPPGELIYLNLPMHPGSKLDTEPPTPPTSVAQKVQVNMGYPGVELTWNPGTDNNWISYYQVFRNGAPIDRVAKGTFYFDHSAGADVAALYEVCSVDGAGNVSKRVQATGRIGQPAKILDDAGDLQFSGQWQHQTGLLPAYGGTLSSSQQKGAWAELSFEGRKVLLFGKLGADCGQAAVSIDGAAAETIDTYSADDIWGVCIYNKEFPNTGRHTLRIEVLSEHNPRAKGAMVHLDGVRIEPM